MTYLQPYHLSAAGTLQRALKFGHSPRTRQRLSRSEIRCCVDLDQRISRLKGQVKEMQSSKTSLLAIMPRFFEFGQSQKIRHKDYKEINENVKHVCQEFKVWNETNGDNYNTMATYIIPKGHATRVEVVALFFAFNYYWDDAFGDDIMASLEREEKREAQLILSGMKNLLLAGQLRENASDCERALDYLMDKLRMSSPPSWMSRFQQALREHLDQGFKERSPRDVIDMSWNEFVDIREAHAGMLYTTYLVEFTSQAFCHMTVFKHLGLDADYREAQKHLTILGAISNDVFSFEKEFLDEEQWFGAVQFLFLTRPDLSLQDVLFEVGRLVDESVIAFAQLLAKMRSAVENSSIEEKLEMLDYIDGLDNLARACCGWQLATRRYKRPDSMFEELVLSSHKAKVRAYAFA